tara:strand:+ start:3952 stop:5166 length:1215 start_codon:yes stop_codon:yes gene_type:complete
MSKIKRKVTRVTKKQANKTRKLMKNAQGMDLQEVQAYGMEPMPIDAEGGSPDLATALNWYSRFKNSKDATKYLVEYAKQLGYDKEEIRLLKKSPDLFIPNSYAWLAKMALNGIKITETQQNRIIVKIREGINQAKYVEQLVEDEKSEPELSVKKSIHEVMREAVNEKASTIMGTLDGWLDDFCDAGMTGEYDLFNYLESIDAKPAHVQIVEDRLGVWLAEFVAARDKLDDDFVEGYSHLTSTQLKTLTQWVEDLKNVASNYSEVKKSRRGPRQGSKQNRLKKIDPIKMSQGINTISINGVHSLDKKNVVGANELWVMDADGYIRHFKSESIDGFTVSGAKLKNVTESVQYKHPMRSIDNKQAYTKLMKKFPTKHRERKSIMDPIFQRDTDVSPRLNKVLIWSVA